MNIKLFGRVGIWWVLLAPIALSACGAFEVARSQCLAEAGTVYQHFLCQYLPAIGSGASIGATAATPSPSDVASVRIGAVSAYATILIGVIATLIGIEALIDKLRVAHRRILTMDCDVFVRGVDRELRAILMNPGRGTVRIRNVIVTDGAALIMPHPDLQIDSGSQVEWTVLAAHTPLPSLIIVQGEFDRADGSGWRFEAEFAITAGISEARRLDLSKR